MKKSERALLEFGKFIFYIMAPVGLVYYFSDPKKIRDGLIKGKYITYQEEAHLENILKAPEGYVKKVRNENGDLVEVQDEKEK